MNIDNFNKDENEFMNIILILFITRKIYLFMKIIKISFIYL